MSYVFVKCWIRVQCPIQCHFSVSRFPFPRFQAPQCWHVQTEYSWKLPAFLPNIQNVVTNSSCWQCLYALISLLYKQLLHYTLLKSFTVPSAVLTEFAKNFYTKLLASAFIFTKLSTKTLLLLRLYASVFHLSINDYCKTRPHRSYCFLSMLKIRCERHYRNLATYNV